MDLTVVAIGAADCLNTGLVAVALSIPPINIAQKMYVSMKYNAIHECQ